HPRGDAPAAPVAFDRHAPHLGPSPILEQSQGGDHPPAARLEGDHVLRLAVAPVQLLLTRHAVFATEDPLAHRHRAPQLLGRAGPADGDRKGLHDSACAWRVLVAKVALTERGVRRRTAISPSSATSRQVIAPMPSPARAPSAAISQPTIGPPIGVEPWKATNHSDITRPRMLGAAFSCRVELPVDMNEMLAPPTSARARSSIGRLGARPANASNTPNAVAAATSVGRPVLPLVATTRPPTTAPTPMAEVMKPKPVAPTCSPWLAITGSVTWNSYARQPTTATKLGALTRKHVPSPTVAISTPATAGPITRATLTITELRLTALRRLSAPTISSMNDCRAGFSKALLSPSSAARRPISHSWTAPVTVSSPSASACRPMAICRTTISRRLSTRSAITPP